MRRTQRVFSLSPLGGGTGRGALGLSCSSISAIASSTPSVFFNTSLFQKSQHVIAAGFQHGRALGIFFALDRMLTAIELKNEVCILAAEVDDVAVDRHLTPELPSV